MNNINKFSAAVEMCAILTVFKERYGSGYIALFSPEESAGEIVDDYTAGDDRALSMDAFFLSGLYPAAKAATPQEALMSLDLKIDCLMSAFNNDKIRWNNAAAEVLIAYQEAKKTQWALDVPQQLKAMMAVWEARMVKPGV